MPNACFLSSRIVHKPIDDTRPGLDVNVDFMLP